MIPEDIIQKYYNEKSKLYKLLLTHSLSVASKALEVARIHPELQLDEAFVYDAALLHDIGIFQTDAPGIYCFGKYPYICHGYLGAAILRQEGLERHARVCERHTGSGLTKQRIVENRLPLPQCDWLPETNEEKLICFADKFYSKSRPEKVKPVDKIRTSLAKYGEDSVARWDEMVKLFLG